jgi:hypothetical protein
MTTVVTVPVAKPLARSAALPEGFEGFTLSDMILPNWRIIQPTTKDVDPKFMGQFYNATAKTVQETLMVVLLKMSHSRSYFKDVSEKAPTCSSDDGIAPRSPGVAIGNVVIPSTCAACPFSKWQEGESPACASGYQLICADVDNGSKFIFRAMKTSAAPIKGLLNEILAKRAPLYGVVVKFATKKGDTGKGNYYVLTPSIAQVLDQDAALTWRAEYLAVKGATIKDADIPDTEQTSDDAPDATPPDESEPLF